MITVQIVARVLEGLSKKSTDRATVGADDAFGDSQDTVKEITTISQQFQRYNLVPPDVDVKTLDAGEGEGEDGDAGDKEIGEEMKNGTAILSQISNFESVDENLYKESNLFQNVDQLTGICPTHYANIAESTS